MIASDGIDELSSLGGQAVPRPLQHSLIYVLTKIDDVGRVSPIPANECRKRPFERQHLPTKPFLECLIVNHRKESIYSPRSIGLTIVWTIPVTPEAAERRKYRATWARFLRPNAPLP